MSCTGGTDCGIAGPMCIPCFTLAVVEYGCCACAAGAALDIAALLLPFIAVAADDADDVGDVDEVGAACT